MGFVPLWRTIYNPMVEPTPAGLVYNPLIASTFEEAVGGRSISAVVMTVLGAEPYMWAMKSQRRPMDIVVPSATHLPSIADTTVLPWGMLKQFAIERVRPYLDLVAHLQTLTDRPIYQLLPPPPVASQERVATQSPEPFKTIIDEHGAPPALLRLKMWLLWRDVVQTLAAEKGVEVLDPPAGALDDDQMLPEIFTRTDAVHANAECGMLVWQQIANVLAREN